MTKMVKAISPPVPAQAWLVRTKFRSQSHTRHDPTVGGPTGGALGGITAAAGTLAVSSNQLIQFSHSPVTTPFFRRSNRPAPYSISCLTVCNLIQCGQHDQRDRLAITDLPATNVFSGC
jgi:hypothetical protein